MTHEDIISLGWKERYKKAKNETHATYVYESPGYDYHIMSVCFGMEEDDGIFEQVMIKCVPEGTLKNEWENSEGHFYGELKTKEELELVMQFVGIIKYKNKADKPKD